MTKRKFQATRPRRKLISGRTVRKMKKEESKDKLTIKEKLGFCKHKWKFIRTTSGSMREIDVCECEKCGKRKKFNVW